MSSNGKAGIGFITFVVVVAGFFIFLDAAQERPWMWIIPTALIAAITFLAWRFPPVRYGIKDMGVFIGDAVGTWFSGGSDAESRQFERKAVPAPVRRSVMARADNRCQYKGCDIADRRKLHIHHIDMDPSNSNDDSNLIVVCANHHHALHSEGIPMNRVREWAHGRYGSSRRRRASVN